MIAKIKAAAQSALAQLLALPKAALCIGIAIGYVCHPIIKLAIDAIRLLMKI